MSCIEYVMHKMMKRFDATNENVKDMRNDLSGIGQKVDSQAVSIKYLEEKMIHLSTKVNPCQYSTLPRSTIKNPKNDGHYMVVTTPRVNKPLIHRCRLEWKLIIVEIIKWLGRRV